MSDLDWFMAGGIFGLVVMFCLAVFIDWTEEDPPSVRRKSLAERDAMRGRQVQEIRVHVDGRWVTIWKNDQ